MANARKNTKSGVKRATASAAVFSLVALCGVAAAANSPIDWRARAVLYAPSADDAAAARMVASIRATGVSGAVVDALGVRRLFGATPERVSRSTLRQAAIREVTAQLDAQAKLDRRSIVVSYTHSHPDTAKAALNVAMGAYLTELTRPSTDRRQRLSVLESDLGAAENAWRKVLLRENISDLESEQRAVEARLVSIDSALASARAEMRARRAGLGAPSEDEAPTVDTIAYDTARARVGSLRSDRVRTAARQARLADLAPRYRASLDYRRSLRQEIADLRRQADRTLRGGEHPRIAGEVVVAPQRRPSAVRLAAASIVMAGCASALTWLAMGRGPTRRQGNRAVSRGASVSVIAQIPRYA